MTWERRCGNGFFLEDCRAATKHMSSVLASESSWPIWSYKQYLEELCQAVCATLTALATLEDMFICLLVSYIMDFIVRISCLCVGYSDLFFHPIFFCIS